LALQVPERNAGLDNPDGKHAKRLAEELERERVRRETRRLLDAEERGPITPPAILTLREWLAQPDSVVHWRITGWLPLEGRVVAAAAMKAGKTTLVGSLVRSLVDGDPWLGRYTVHPVTGTVAVIDTEMSRVQLRRWFKDQRIVNDDRVLVVPLRGSSGALDLVDPGGRARWVEWLRSHDVCCLILDCLRPVLDALGLDEHRDVGRWLVALDAQLKEGGISEAVVVHHMGHVAERSRGDSRLRDWPDAEWRIVRQSDDPASPRYIAAYGRDVHIAESVLTYDQKTRRFTIADGSRRDATIRAALSEVLAVLKAAREPLSLRSVERACANGGHPRSAVRSALVAGVKTGSVVKESGPRGSILHRLPEQCTSAPECAGNDSAQSTPSTVPVRGRSNRAARSHGPGGVSEVTLPAKRRERTLRSVTVVQE